MNVSETASRLAEFEHRGAGSDSERRAANWLAAELQAAGRQVRVEPFWCRPNWALAGAWHVALGLAGSLLSVHSPRVGGVMLLIALLSVISDWAFGVSLGRLLTPERASQNVIGLPPPRSRDKPVRLILTANLDAGRAGLVYRDGLRSIPATLRRAVGPATPGWLGWVAIALAGLLAVAVVRLTGSNGSAIGLIQLLPTVGLVLALAALLELSSSEFAPGAGDNGSGVAAVMAIARALDAAPPGAAAVEVVLAGAGDGSGLGLRRYLRDRRQHVKAHNTVVVGVGACGGGRPHWWHSDGALIPMRHFGALRDICRRLGGEDPGLELSPYRGRGSSPALPARLAGLPSIAIGCLDDRGLVPHSHQLADTGAAVLEAPLDAVVELGLLLTDEIDGFIARMDPAPRRQRPAARRLLGGA